MQLCDTIAGIRAAVAGFRAEGGTVALVPTMGFLHDGHMALVARAQSLASHVVVTIFVNPAQFGEQADLDSYPRNEEADLAKLRAAGVDAVLLPPVEAIYPPGDETIVETTRMANMLHGAVRPGHFRGVTTVVSRLFNITGPDIAIFGEKDYQQLQIIRRMTADLHFPLRIEGVPTVREADGLAMSSRNVRLTPEDRAAAPVLNRALTAAAELAATGARPAALRALIEETVASEPRASLTGLDIVSAGSLAPLPEGPLDQLAAVMISARFGEVMLIDQREMGPGR